MIEVYGQKLLRSDLLKRVGDISQIAGFRTSTRTEGNEKGVSAVDFYTGTGFFFTVLPDRGLDISFASYRGIPLCWRSSTGDVAPHFYETQGDGWLRSFYGGLLTTCGMVNVGSANEDVDEQLGLHGRVSNIPAKNVWADTRWEGDRYQIWIQGKVRETSVFGHNLERTRRVSTELGSNSVKIEDLVENIGWQQAPLMILFHINIGWPILDQSTEFFAPSTQVKQHIAPSGQQATTGQHDQFDSPQPDCQEQVFLHDMQADGNNHVYVILANRDFNLEPASNLDAAMESASSNKRGIGIYVRYHKTQFPRFVQWKMLGESIYCVGLEPANCGIAGRATERATGEVQHLEPGGRRHYEVEIGVLTDNNQINEVASLQPS